MELAYTFDAVIQLLPTHMGGRRTAVRTHYRPNFNFNTEQYFCGEIRFKEGVEWIAPGQSAEATIVLLAARFIPGDLVPGYAFKLTEGKRVVGTGVIREVLKREEVDIEEQVVA